MLEVYDKNKDYRKIYKEKNEEIKNTIKELKKTYYTEIPYYLIDMLKDYKIYVQKCINSGYATNEFWMIQCQNLEKTFNNFMVVLVCITANEKDGFKILKSNRILKEFYLQHIELITEENLSKIMEDNSRIYARLYLEPISEIENQKINSKTSKTNKILKLI